MWPRTLLVLAAVAGCAHAPACAPRRRRGDATEAYLGRLLAGDRAAIAAGFAGRAVNRRSVRGRGARRRPRWTRSSRERHAWLAARARAAVGPVRSRARTAAPSSRRCCSFTTRATTSICRSRSSATTRPTGGVRALRVYHASGRSRAITGSARRCCARDPDALVDGRRRRIPARARRRRRRRDRRDVRSRTATSASRRASLGSTAGRPSCASS